MTQTQHLEAHPPRPLFVIELGVRLGPGENVWTAENTVSNESYEPATRTKVISRRVRTTTHLRVL